MEENPWIICAECAKEKNWGFPKWPVTVHEDTCPWCKKENVTVIPVVDFVTDNGEDPIWD